MSDTIVPPSDPHVKADLPLGLAESLAEQESAEIPTDDGLDAARDALLDDAHTLSDPKAFVWWLFGQAERCKARGDRAGYWAARRRALLAQAELYTAGGAR